MCDGFLFTDYKLKNHVVSGQGGNLKENCFQNRTRSNVVASVSESNTCVCNESLHRFNVTLGDNNSKKIVGKMLLYCN